jgi:hypothetical protein
MKLLYGLFTQTMLQQNCDVTELLVLLHGDAKPAAELGWPPADCSATAPDDSSAVQRSTVTIQAHSNDIIKTVAHFAQQPYRRLVATLPPVGKVQLPTV